MRRKIKNRNIVEPDIMYNSQKLGKFINNIMIHGKKETARKSVYKAFEIIKEKNSKLKMPQYLSTHPDTDERISRLKSIIDQANTNSNHYTKLSSGNNWNQIKKSCSIVTKPGGDAKDYSYSETK